MRNVDQSGKPVLVFEVITPFFYLGVSNDSTSVEGDGVDH